VTAEVGPELRAPPRDAAVVGDLDLAHAVAAVERDAFERHGSPRDNARAIGRRADERADRHAADRHGVLRSRPRLAARTARRGRSRRAPRTARRAPDAAAPRSPPRRRGAKRRRLLPEHCATAVTAAFENFALRSASDSSSGRSTRPVTRSRHDPTSTLVGTGKVWYRTKKASFGVIARSNYVIGVSSWGGREVRGIRSVFSG